MLRLAMWLGWIPFGLLLTPVWLDGKHYEGYRPEQDELTLAAAVIVTGVALLLGAVHGMRTTRAACDLPLVVAATAVLAVVYLAANDAVYRWVIPLPDDLRGGSWSFVLVLLPVAASAVAFGVGSLRRRPPAPIPGRRRYLAAVAVALLGVYAVTGFVRVGAELATSFDTGTTIAAAPMDLPAGRHAIYHLYNDRPPSCTVAGIPVERASVEFTDNSDSIVTVLYGVFEMPAAGRAGIDCPRGIIGAPPVTRGPLGDLIFAPIALLCLIGALPGVLLALGVRATRRKALSTVG